MAADRIRRMHTVAKSYFEAFAVDDPTRRETAGIWRFNRASGAGKIVGVKDSEVVRDIYTVYEDDKPDTGIEDVLGSLETAFADARRILLNRQNVLGDRVPLTKEQWSGLARFIAAQLLRTPRFFQDMRTYLDANDLQYDDDAPQRVMLVLIDRWIMRLVRMRGIIAYTETDLPLLTSDNPAVMWKKQGNSFVCGGINQYDPELVVSCPLSPTVLYVAYQTPESLKAVHAERHDIPRAERQPEMFMSHVDFGSMPEWELKRQNLICVTNAHKNVYSSYCNKPLLKFLHNCFFDLADAAAG